MTTFAEQTYEQCLNELQKLGVSSSSLDEYLAKVVPHIKEHLDFLFVGIAFLKPDHYVRFYLGTGDQYRKRMGLSLDSSDPISITIRNGRPLLIDLDANENIFKNPDLPAERIRFFLPLKSQEGVFGAMEVVSAVSLKDNDKIKVISSLEILVTEVASSCSRFMDRSTIGFWLESAN